MAETTNDPKKVITFEAFQAASALIPSKEEVAKQIQDAGGAQFVPVTTEEVVALFQNRTTGGEGGGTT